MKHPARVAALVVCAAVAGWGGGESPTTEANTATGSAGEALVGERYDPSSRTEVLASIERSGTYVLDVDRIVTHTHAQLTVVVDGRTVQVDQVGVDLDTLTAAPIHTHDTTGVLHVETDEDHPTVPSIQDFLEIWHGASDLNALCGVYGGGGQCQTRITVNGVVSTVMHQPDDGDDIVIEIDLGMWV